MFMGEVAPDVQKRVTMHTIRKLRLAKCIFSSSVSFLNQQHPMPAAKNGRYRVESRNSPVNFQVSANMTCMLSQYRVNTPPPVVDCKFLEEYLESGKGYHVAI